MNCKSTKSAIKHKNCTINKMVLYLCIKVSGRRRRMVISVGAQSAAVRTRYFAPAPTNEKSRRIQCKIRPIHPPIQTPNPQWHRKKIAHLTLNYFHAH